VQALHEYGEGDGAEPDWATQDPEGPVNLAGRARKYRGASQLLGPLTLGLELLHEHAEVMVIERRQLTISAPVLSLELQWPPLKTAAAPSQVVGHDWHPNNRHAHLK
jgi:hypothetical protein